MKALLFSFSLAIGFFLQAQPSTEVYLFDLSKWGISNPLNISNNEGYDNQPSFWPDGESIIYARTVEGQTEIARYIIGSGQTKIITNTKQGSEYSPTPIMGSDRISSIRLDTTGLQLLYAYDEDGTSEVLVPELVIGYHAWISKNKLVAFVLGEPHTLHLINTKNGESEVVAENVGRSLHKIPTRKFASYVDKSQDLWVITGVNEKGEKEQLITTVEGSEDYCWTPTREIIMGSGTKLFYWTYGGAWTEFADLNQFGLGAISRVSVSPDGNRLVVVVAND